MDDLLQLLKGLLLVNASKSLGLRRRCIPRFDILKSRQRAPLLFDFQFGNLTLADLGWMNPIELGYLDAVVGCRAKVPIGVLVLLICTEHRVE